MDFECPNRVDWNWDVSYQWTLSRNNCVEIDSDAVGIGVVVACVISASVLFVAVVTGYLTSSIPDDILNDFDRILTNKFQALISRSPSNELEKKRTNALVHFLLALGDQQTVTALALIIAGYAHKHDITIYAMNVTGALTLLSSTVYISILPITTARDRELKALSTADGFHPQGFGQFLGLAKHFRFISIVFVFLGMTILFVLGEGSHWWPEENESDLYFLCGFRNFSISREHLFTAIINFFILSGFVIGYVDATICLYTDEISFIGWIIRRLESSWGAERYSTPQDYIVLRSAAFTTCRWNWWQASLLDESYAFHVFNDSFASWQLIQLAFAIVYGTINVFMSRTLKVGLTGNADTWGFGQIVPMILLALPVLAALEARHDYKISDIIQGPIPAQNEAHNLKIDSTPDEVPASVGDSSSPTKPGREDGGPIESDFMCLSDAHDIPLGLYSPQPSAPSPSPRPSRVLSTTAPKVSVQETLDSTAELHRAPDAPPSSTILAPAARTLSNPPSEAGRKVRKRV